MSQDSFGAALDAELFASDDAEEEHERAGGSDGSGSSGSEGGDPFAALDELDAASEAAATTAPSAALDTAAHTAAASEAPPRPPLPPTAQQQQQQQQFASAPAPATTSCSHPGFMFGLCIRCGAPKPEDGGGGGGGGGGAQSGAGGSGADAAAAAAGGAAAGGAGAAGGATRIRHLHARQALEVSAEEAARITAGAIPALLASRRLVLVLDLDHTLLNSARESDISAAERPRLEEILRRQRAAAEQAAAAAGPAAGGSGKQQPEQQQKQAEVEAGKADDEQQQQQQEQQQPMETDTAAAAPAAAAEAAGRDGGGDADGGGDDADGGGAAVGLPDDMGRWHPPQLFHLAHCRLWTKLRPGLREFLTVRGGGERERGLLYIVLLPAPPPLCFGVEAQNHNEQHTKPIQITITESQSLNHNHTITKSYLQSITINHNKYRNHNHNQQAAAELYELHIYTMGDRAYAREIAKIIDPRGRLFAGRVVSAADSTKAHEKGLDVLLASEAHVLILDDTEHVWAAHRRNLLQIERYHFFGSSVRSWQPLARGLLEGGADEGAATGALATCLRLLKEAHAEFFRGSGGDGDAGDGAGDGGGGDEGLDAADGAAAAAAAAPATKRAPTKRRRLREGGEPGGGGTVSGAASGRSGSEGPAGPADSAGPAAAAAPAAPAVLPRPRVDLAALKGRDVRACLADVRARALRGCRVVFSRCWPQQAAPFSQPLWALAEALGADCSTRYVPGRTTHVVAAPDRAGELPLTDKVAAARRDGARVVHYDWLVACKAAWARADEAAFEMPGYVRAGGGVRARGAGAGGGGGGGGGDAERDARIALRAAGRAAGP